MKVLYCPKCGSIIKFTSNFCYNCGFDLVAYMVQKVKFTKSFSNSDLKKFYDDLSKIEPDNFNAWFSKGLILYNEGKFSEALECFEKTIEIESNHKEAQQFIGLTLKKLNRFSKKKVSKKVNR